MNWRELHGDNGDVPEWPDGAENAPEFHRKRDMLEGGRGHKIWIVYKALQRLALAASDDQKADDLVEKLYRAVTGKNKEDIKRLDIVDAVRHSSIFYLDLGESFYDELPLFVSDAPDMRSDAEILEHVKHHIADPQLALLVAKVSPATVAAAVRLCSRKPQRPDTGQPKGLSKVEAFSALFAALGMAVGVSTVRDTLAIPPRDWDDE